MISLIYIAIAGGVVGAVTNRVGLLGNNLFNFAFAVFVEALHWGLVSLGYHGFSDPVILFLRWYFVGTFAMKLLAIVPIPYVQPVARHFS